MSAIEKANLALIIDLMNRMGKSGDAADVTTLFAHLAKVEGLTDSIETILGTNADPAATNASMWAMLKSLGRPVGTKRVINTPVVASTYYPLVSVSGVSGKVIQVYFIASALNVTVKLRVTIDGVLYADATHLTGSNSANGSIDLYGTLVIVNSLLCNLTFKNTLLIEAYADVNLPQVTFKVLYETV